MSRTALITGISGQDGFYLAQELIAAGYRVAGTVRSLALKTDRLQNLSLGAGIELAELDFLDLTKVQSVLDSIRPDIIFNLAAVSSLARSESHPSRTQQVNGLAPLHILDLALEMNSSVRFVQASSSLVFSPDATSPLSEGSPRGPDTHYGRAKLFADTALAEVRMRGAFASSALLFNHESPLRPDRFVSQKIVTGLLRLKAKTDEVMQLGLFDDARDWSHASDFATAFHLISELNEPGEFVFASGSSHTVRDWLAHTAEAIGFKPQFHGSGQNEHLTCARSGRVLARVSTGLIRTDEPLPRVGDNRKLRKKALWSPRFTFETLVEDMVRSATDRFV